MKLEEVIALNDNAKYYININYITVKFLLYNNLIKKIDQFKVFKSVINSYFITRVSIHTFNNMFCECKCLKLIFKAQGLLLYY